MPHDPTATVRVEFAVASERFRAEIAAPVGPTPTDTLLPVLQGLTDTIVGVAAAGVEAAGETIRCRAGCGACCRQLVPISEAEARALRRLVQELPEPRREEVYGRFAEALRRLQEVGALEKLRERQSFEYDELLPFGLEYFRLGISCPFLVEESCSIHPDRPLSCREYLVTSPPENCAEPTRETVRLVNLPAKLSVIVNQLDADPQARYVRWVPLILALEWAEAHPEPEPPTRTGPELLREIFERLAAGSPIGVHPKQGGP